MKLTSCASSLALLTVLAGCGGRSASAPTTVTDQPAASLTSTIASAFNVPGAVDGPAAEATAPSAVSWKCLAQTAERDTGVFSVVASPPDCPRPFAALATGAAPYVPNTPPAQPTNLTFAVTGSTLVLNWFEPCRGFAIACASGEPQSYIIEAGTANGLADLANFDTGSAATSLGIPNVPEGTYFVRVRTSNFFGISPPSNQVTITVGTLRCGSPPPAPNTLAASVTDTTISLSWNAPGGGCAPTTYVLEAGSTPGASNLANFATGSTETTFATAAPVGTYFLRVRARNGEGTSGASNEIRVVVGQTCVAPGSPNLTYSTSSSSTSTLLTLNWEAPTTGTPPFTYIIEAGTIAGGSDVYVGNIGADRSLTTHVADGIYFVRVKAVNACGTSAASNEVSFTAAASPFVYLNPGGIIPLPPGPIGRPYPSLCQPAPRTETDLCQPTGAPGTNDPSGGQPPYRFQRPTGGRFTPFRVTLNLNGLLTGTAAAGVFDVEVVDLAGNVASSSAASLGSLTSAMFRRPGHVAAAASTSRAFTIVVTDPCTFAVSPTTATVPAIGGSVTLSVTTQSTCNWTVTNTSDVFVTDVRATNGTATATGGSGTGSGTVTLLVNGSCRACGGTGLARTLTIVVAGQTVTINQAADTPACTAAPNAPTGLSASASGNTIVLRWSAPSSGQLVTSYFVEVGTSSGSANTVSTSTGSTTTSYTTSTLSNGTYYVRVRASNSCGRGVASNEVSVTLGSIPPATLAFSITSATCRFSRSTGPFDYEYEVAVAGTAGGPVGARLVLPSLSGYIRQSWSSSWGSGTSNVDDRGASQPATTSWTATLVIGRSPGSSVTVSGYVRNSENTQRVTDQRTLTCQ